MLGHYPVYTFPHLQRLELHIHDARPMHQPPVSPQLNAIIVFSSRVLRVLETTALQRLLLHVSCYTWTTLCSTAISDPPTQAAWSLLDETLCLPQYETAKVCVSASTWNEEQDRWWAVPGEGVCQLLPNSASRDNTDITEVSSSCYICMAGIQLTCFFGR